MPINQLAAYLEARFKPVRSVADRYRAIDKEAGLTTTEVAVLSFMLVGIAVVIGATLLAAARGNAEKIDEIEVPDFSGQGG